MTTMSIRYLNWMFLISAVWAADSIFKSCEESDFCNRLRDKNDGTIYHLAYSETNGSFLTGILKNNKNSKDLLFSIEILEDAYRIIIDEPKPSSRYHLSGVLNGTPKSSTFKNLTFDEKNAYWFATNDYISSIELSPFRVKFYRKKGMKLVAVINGRDRFTMESDEPNVAIALDIAFLEAQRAYGIPEHADTLPLRTTTVSGIDPYRLFNVDMTYGLDSTMSLYGSIPVLYAHATSLTMGVFWHNSAETWVDINNTDNGVETYFMSESGVLDLFVLKGPTPQDAVRQYASLTGTAPLPQYFTLGYHQSRWNYMSEEEVQTVVAEFDKHDFPLDVMWLDIEYTDGKKYFTWNPETFPTPLKMQANLTATNRKLVTIIDPHIKKEVGYFVYDQGLDHDLFVKNANGSVFEGNCWPGLSTYLDFLNPDAQKYYEGLYSFDVFKGSTENTYIWNDMNEPAVFDDFAEKTFPKDTVHYGNVKHRDVHNIYGFLQTKGTYQALLTRSENKKRPFVLSRSHFAGSQRYTAVWTGDNTADWGHLAASLPMCLSEALAGISFCGADIGGFFNEPTTELLQRWYQIGAWLPFYREHSVFESKHREPYLYAKDVQAVIRTALQQRYAHLPLWYTLFWEHERYGDPVIRPLFFNYPYDANVVDIETQLLIGTNVMVKAVTKSGLTSVDVYFPGGETERWYDASDYHIRQGVGSTSINITQDKIPVYYRGGSIIVRKDIPRPTSVDMADDSYTLYVYPNVDNVAEGTLYIDDMESFNYQQGEYTYIRFTSEKNTLKNTREDVNAHYQMKARLDRIVFAHPPTDINNVRVTGQGKFLKEIPVEYRLNYLEVNNLGLDISEPFVLKWE